MRKLLDFFSIIVTLSFLAMPILLICEIFTHKLINFVMTDGIIFIFSVFMVYAIGKYIGENDE